MGTFYVCCASLEFEGASLEAWLDATLPQGPWEAGTSVRSVLASVAEGGFANGTEIAPLAVHVEPPSAQWSWRRVASEVAPEVLALGRALWACAVRVPGARGVFAYRDELGPESLWDHAEVLDAGRSVRVDRWLPVLWSAPYERGEAAGASCDEDIPF